MMGGGLLVGSNAPRCISAGAALTLEMTALARPRREELGNGRSTG